MSIVIKPFSSDSGKRQTDGQKTEPMPENSQTAAASKPNSKPNSKPDADKTGNTAAPSDNKPAPDMVNETTQISTPRTSSEASSSDSRTNANKTGNEAPPSENKPSNKVQPARSSSRRDDNITTIIYDKKNDAVNILSEELSFDGDVDTIVKEIVEQKDSFGTLSSRGVIYYKEKTENEYKIAATDVSYIGSHMIKIILILSAAFLLSMGLVLLISLRLSKFAVRPMENAIEMERKFVADISHDLKTPITVILANNSILKSDPESRIMDNRQWIDSNENAANDMMKLISEMLTMSSLESADHHIEKTPLDLSSVAERCVLQFESVAYEKKVELEENIEKGITVLGTEDYLRRICSGLIDNALKYEPENGKVTVSVFTQKRRAWFVVQNSGSRISQEDISHIFDRFYRADKTRNLYSGHGLGLPIIRQMTKLLGGEIHAHSSEQEGTRFTVILDTV